MGGNEISKKMCVKTNKVFLSFLESQDFDATININHFCVEKFFSSKEMVLQLLMEDVQAIVVEETELENTDVKIDNLSGISTLSRIGSEDKTYVLRI